MITLNSKPKVLFEHLESKDIKYSDIAKYLSAVGGYYPNFKSWLYFTFRKEMIEGKRSIVIAHYGDSLAGLSLLKHTVDEKKNTSVLSVAQTQIR